MAFTIQERSLCAQQLLERLQADGMEVGERLPGETVLCSELSVTRHLVRLALGQLEDEGFIERREKSGSYLIRPPAAGAVATPSRGLAPVSRHSRTVCIMLTGPQAYPQIRELQQHAMRRGFLLQPYFAAAHDNSPAEEQHFLRQAWQEGYRGAVLHPTPQEEGDRELFHELSTHLRLAHLSYHSTELPEQSFFLPDYRIAGAMAGGALLAHGCRRLLLVTGLPSDHHVCKLLREGLASAAAAAQCPTDTHGSVLPWNAEAPLEAWLAAGPELGIACYSENTLRHLHERWQALAPDAQHPRLVTINDDRAAPHPASTVDLCFDWRARAMAALDFVMGDSNSLVHRLYSPRVTHPAAS